MMTLLIEYILPLIHLKNLFIFRPTIISVSITTNKWYTWFTWLSVWSSRSQVAEADTINHTTVNNGNTLSLSILCKKLMCMNDKLSFHLPCRHNRESCPNIYPHDNENTCTHYDYKSLSSLETLGVKKSGTNACNMNSQTTIEGRWSWIWPVHTFDAKLASFFLQNIHCICYNILYAISCVIPYPLFISITAAIRLPHSKSDCCSSLANHNTVSNWWIPVKS